MYTGTFKAHYSNCELLWSEMYLVFKTQSLPIYLNTKIIFLEYVLKIFWRIMFFLLLLSHSVMSDCLWPHGLQHARLPSSLSPSICSNLRPLHRWWHPTISSSVTPVSSFLRSVSASGSFPMRWIFSSGSQSIRASTSVSSPYNEHSGLISFRIDFFGFLEKAMATHSSTLAWKIPWTEEPGGLQSMVSLRVGHDWVTSLLLFTLMHWRRKWQPMPVLLPGKSNGWRSLVGCRLCGRTESDMTEAT